MSWADVVGARKTRSHDDRGIDVRVDIFAGGLRLQDVQQLAKQAEAGGFSGLIMTEGGRTAYLSVAAAALATERITFNTGIALAFTRSPMLTAGIAWELADASEGRFSLGLGTQVKAHIERRYGMEFSPPGPRMREYVEAVRHIWDCFQNGTKLDYQGEYYKLSLLNAQWSAGRIDYPDIPLYISAVGPYMLRTAGELCDGVHVHPFHSRNYLDEVVLPTLAEGAARGNRDVDEVKLAIPVLTAVGSGDELARSEKAVKSQLAFYGSTKNYARVFDHHGYEGVSAQLNDKMKTGDIAGMSELITEEMVQTYGTVADWDAMSDALIDRYDGVADSVILYFATSGWRKDPTQLDRWAEVARDVIARTES